MQILLVCVAALALLAGKAKSEEVEAHILELYTQDQPEHKVLVMLHSPNCGACKAFMPVFEDIEKSLDTKCFSINAKDNMFLKAQYGLHSYPTLLLIENGVLYRFNGTRNRERVIEFAEFRGEFASQIGETAPPPATIFTVLRHDFGVLCTRMEMSWTRMPTVMETHCVLGIVIGIAGTVIFAYLVKRFVDHRMVESYRREMEEEEEEKAAEEEKEEEEEEDNSK